MKLLFAIKRLEDMPGGAERVILQVIDGLRRGYGHQISLVTFDRGGAKSFYPIPDGVEWIQLGIGDSSQRAGWTETIHRIVRLRQVVMSHAPDIVIPFQHSMFVPMVLSLLGAGVPIVASEHTVPDHYRCRPLEYGLLTFTGLLCRKITVLSDAIIRIYPKCLWSRMVAMPNPVATSPRPADVVGGRESERKILLSVGRLDVSKDQATLIDAFALIADKFPDWDLKIFGEGRLRSDLETRIVTAGMQGRIFLMGATPDILSEYQKAQAFVLASRYEAFGLATAEAMSAGLPVVGFADCPGTNELIQNDRNGLLVIVSQGAGRADSLARTLTALMGDVALRQSLGAQGRADMAAVSVDAVVAKWQSLLDNAI